MKRWLIVMAVGAVFMGSVLATRADWDGDITETAAEPLAAGAGVAESHLLPWRIEGDLLLFVFLAGGVAAGFAAGYYWREIFSNEHKPSEQDGNPGGMV